MNSLYGAMASPYFRFFDLRMAEGITLTGQLAIQWTANEINKFLNKACGTENTDYIVYCDTDSAYVNLEKIVNQKVGNKSTEEKNFLRRFCRNLLPKQL